MGIVRETETQAANQDLTVGNANTQGSYRNTSGASQWVSSKLLLSGLTAAADTVTSGLMLFDTDNATFLGDTISSASKFDQDSTFQTTYMKVATKIEVGNLQYVKWWVEQSDAALTEVDITWLDPQESNDYSRTDWYVSTAANGGDAANGATGWGDAEVTVAAGIAAADAGDTVNVGPGTFSEDQTITQNQVLTLDPMAIITSTNNTVASNSNLVINGGTIAHTSAGTAVALTGSDPSILNDVTVTSTNTAVFVAEKTLTITGGSISGITGIITTSVAATIYLIDCHVSGSGTGAISITGTTTVIAIGGSLTGNIVIGSGCTVVVGGGCKYDPTAVSGSGTFSDLDGPTGTPVALDGGAANLAAMLTKMADDNAGADFDATVASLQSRADGAQAIGGSGT